MTLDEPSPRIRAHEILLGNNSLALVQVYLAVRSNILGALPVPILFFRRERIWCTSRWTSTVFYFASRSPFPLTH